MSENSRRFQLSAKITTLLAALLVSVIIAEASMWIFFPTPFHEWMEWQADGHIKGRGRPNTSFSTETGYEVKLNSLGFRGPDRSWRPAAGTLRIVTLGGSSTFNYHAKNEEETWSAILGRRLSLALNIPTEVINLSMPGFSSEESKINYLTTARQLHPHVIVFYHTWNDLKFFRPLELDPASVVFARPAIDGQHKPVWQKIARTSQIGRKIRNLLLRLDNKKRENHYTSLEKAGEKRNIIPDSVAFEWARKNFEDIANFANQDGVIPVLVSQATLVAPVNLGQDEIRLAISNDLVGMTLPVLAKSWKKMREIIENVATDRGAIYVDGYDAVPHDLLHLSDHVHLTGKGTDRLGGAIASRLLLNTKFRLRVERIEEK